MATIVNTKLGDIEARSASGWKAKSYCVKVTILA